jgi:hypothetical protein
MRSGFNTNIFIMQTLFGKLSVLLIVILLISPYYAALQNPRDNFCRRYGHQATVIDDKLYIDGGFVNFDTFAQDHTDFPSKPLRPSQDTG